VDERLIFVFNRLSTFIFVEILAKLLVWGLGQIFFVWNLSVSWVSVLFVMPEKIILIENSLNFVNISKKYPNYENQIPPNFSDFIRFSNPFRTK
jgi:hypothetical protein